MPSFQQLLSRSYAFCNRSGTLLALGVAAWGIGILLLQMLLWQQITLVTSRQVRQMVGATHYDEIRQTAEKPAYSSDDIDALYTYVLAADGKKLDTLPPDARDRAVTDMELQIAKALLPVLLLFGGILFLLRLLAKHYFLVLAAVHPSSFGFALRRMLVSFLPVLWTWILMALFSFLWLPFALEAFALLWPVMALMSLAGFVPVLLLLPRFLYAPIILLQESQSPMASIRLSYRRTKGQWRWIMLQVIGVLAVLWMVMTFSNTLLQALVQAVALRSPLAPLLYWVASFTTLIALAYRLVFIVQMKEATDGKTKGTGPAALSVVTA